jgi:hypothetical protein
MPGTWTGVPVFLTAVLLGAATHANAQIVALAIERGRVTLEARDVAVSEILDQWARAGRVTIINNDSALARARVTVSLTDVPEREALATLLRDASGYVLAPRRQPSAQASTIDRVVIMPRSNPASVPSTTRVAAPPTSVSVPAAFVIAAPSNDPDSDNADGDTSRASAQNGGLPASQTSTGMSTPANPAIASPGTFGLPVRGGVVSEGDTPNLPAGVQLSADGDEQARYRKLIEQAQQAAEQERSNVPQNPFGVRRGTPQPAAPAAPAPGQTAPDTATQQTAQ